ncbi:UDP-N-acetylmuramoyl-L-alanyl-D-glutamate--2,6-diaminopimelate ligase [Paenibacillus ginsengarvi]|uniref:UDP-N-acetylmuramoyl-L-alanyl-D-glutamate--2,6-diaminopimelate ligase n=1 Tax=Paenibacillus ginsengarvi TaxID=400777 RepID=A0A3B0CHS1_9BACL|nr:UDP-N-acetylmuramoyl-L-alanyl-D-glutamate--2,6-diaminopimelate ligase [Paenibacillus ginsengarvi]RKN83837.1 UDP-N-acetylmuramoyl-L-alanyl-D-glutamate--2,6-diaminopimelate ligase [Paenibacillus ginsengarvi]
MKLRELAGLLATARTYGDMEVEISGFSMHTQTLRPGELFVCVSGIPGFQEDRHPFAGEAVRLGAAAIVAEREVGLDVPTVVVPDARYVMAVMACHYYGYPSERMKLIGVTGTKGKTTAAHMIETILSLAGNRTGLMGNLGTKIGGKTAESTTNTQEPHRLQANLSLMEQARTEYAVMEVTSQGIAMGRVLGCEFRTAVFTNLTHDHLDFHGTMEAYRHAKGLLFSWLGSGFAADPEKRTFAILNADDQASDYFRSVTAAQVITYGIKAQADVRAEGVKLKNGGTAFELVTFAGTVNVKLRMVGLFNVYNALAAAACALAEHTPLPTVRKGLEQLEGVPGRMEVVDEGQSFLVLVDYAHTPDSLDNALSTVKQFAEGQVITVFGCGGDRDRTKRPVMGKIASTYSDRIMVTSDNPRSESPEAILQEIERGLVEGGADSSRYELIADRREAIRRAIGLAGAGDVVVIAGKGHETYQITGGSTVHFDDREEARLAIREEAGSQMP